MVTKLTVRLPDHLAKRLRERSQETGGSLNDVALHALARGLEAPETGDGDDKWWLTLGDLLEEPPERPLDLAEVQQLRQGLRFTPEEVQGFMDDLDWVRSDRF